MRFRGRWTPAAIAGLAMFVTIAVFSGIAQIPYVGFVGNLLNLFVGAFVSWEDISCSGICFGEKMPI